MVDVIDLTKIAVKDIAVDGVPVKNVDYGMSPVYASRPSATDGIGVSVKGITHIKDALIKAGLDYRVVQVPIFAEGQEIPHRVANIRSDNRKFIEVVSNRYTPFQNDQAYAFLENMTNSGALQIETAGQFGEGAVWIEARTPENITVMGDKFYPYALVRNSHDGTSGVKVCFTFTRVVCENTLAAAVRGAPRIWQARHLRNIEGRMEDAKKMLEVMDAYAHEYPVMAEKLAAINLTEDETVSVLKKMFPLKADATVKTIQNAMGSVKEILTIYNKTPDLTKFNGTAWGFFNAVGDYVTHTAPGRETPNWKQNRLLTLADGHPLIDVAQKELLAIPA